VKHFEIWIYFLLAAFGIYVGAASRDFYPGRLGRNATGKPLPRWFGRLWCFGFAVVMLYLGIRGLR
jgi:hypothetical protein